MTRLGRQYIENSPMMLLRVQGAAKVRLWESPTVNRQDASESIFVAYSAAQCTHDKGIPLPRSHPLEITLAAGASLWAMCPDMALVCWALDPVGE